MTADHIIENIRGENAALAADRAAWITAANTWMKRAKGAEAEKADILAELSQSHMEIMGRGETITILEAEIDALRKALQPFKAFADAYDEDQLRRNGVDPRKYDLSDKSTVATSGIFGTSTWRVITAGDCRRARTLAGDNHE
jgi:hypothetical protein